MYKVIIGTILGCILLMGCQETDVSSASSIQKTFSKVEDVLAYQYGFNVGTKERLDALERRIEILEYKRRN